MTNRVECQWCDRTFSTKHHLARHQHNSCDAGLYKHIAMKPSDIPAGLLAMAHILESTQIPDELKYGPVMTQIIAGLENSATGLEEFFAHSPVAPKETISGEVTKSVYNCPYCGEKFDNISRAVRHFNECDKKRFEVPRHIPAGSQNPTTLEVQLTEDEALLMLNGLLAYIEPLVRDFVTSIPIELWMVTAVKLTKRLYYTLTEAYPSLRKEQAIRQWWDDHCSRTGRPYYEEYDTFIATFEASN